MIRTLATKNRSGILIVKKAEVDSLSSVVSRCCEVVLILIYYCQDCDMDFSSIQSLQSHQLSCHQGEVEEGEDGEDVIYMGDIGEEGGSGGEGLGLLVHAEDEGQEEAPGQVLLAASCSFSFLFDLSSSW